MHTPTPWKKDASGHYRGSDGRQVVLALSGLALSCGVPSETAIANGEFVDRCVNAHDDLLAALRRAERTLLSMHNDGWKIGGDLIIEIRAAIAKATGA